MKESSLKTEHIPLTSRDSFPIQCIHRPQHSPQWNSGLIFLFLLYFCIHVWSHICGHVFQHVCTHLKCVEFFVLHMKLFFSFCHVGPGVKYEIVRVSHLTRLLHLTLYFYSLFLMWKLYIDVM